MKVLITCGPTWVPIDDVRVISNISSGKMGHLIAEEFRKAKAQVTLIEGQVTHVAALAGVKIIKYRFFDELAKVLKIELSKKYDVVVHAAAISDFKVKGVAQTKIASDKAIALNLVPTEKLISSIKRLASDTLLVGFKLESHLNLKNIQKVTQKLFVESGCDVVVANSLAGGYQGFIVNADGVVMAKATSKKSIAKNLVKLII